MGDQPAGSDTRVPLELILAISCGVKLEKNDSATADPFGCDGSYSLNERGGEG
jgi:hypothetical protein